MSKLFSFSLLLSLLMLSTACDDNDEISYGQRFSDGTTPAVSPLDTSLSPYWRVDHFFDEYDETELFTPYRFDFREDGRVYAISAQERVSGRWAVRSYSSREELFLDFGAHPILEELNEDDWRVMELSESKMDLREDDEVLRLVRGGSLPSTQASTLDSLLWGDWRVRSFLDDGKDDETAEWRDLRLRFRNDGSLGIYNAQGALAQGLWYSTSLSSGAAALSIRMYSRAGVWEELDETWELAVLPDGALRLREYDENPADVMVLEEW